MANKTINKPGIVIIEGLSGGKYKLSVSMNRKVNNSIIAFEDLRFIEIKPASTVRVEADYETEVKPKVNYNFRCPVKK